MSKPDFEQQVIMKISIKLALLTLILTIALLITWCTIQYRNIAVPQQDTVDCVLKIAGDNRPEIEKVLHHYRSDSLKHLASEFLIKNMSSYSSEKWRTFRKEKQDTLFSLKAFNSCEKAIHVMDSLNIQFSLIRTSPDIHTINSMFLINNIDMAFESWGKPWAKHLSFADFCEYLLPYRIDNEELENYRSILSGYYNSLFYNAQQCPLGYNALSLVNGQLLKEIRWRPQMALYPGKLTVEQMHRLKIGDCNHLSDYGIKVFRTLGIAIAKDFAIWGNNDAGHTWTVALLNEGQIPFVACDVQPGEFSFWYRPSKIYRRTFSAQQPGMLKLKAPEQEIPSELNLSHCRDVTDMYYETIEITVPILINVPKGNNLAFLCVYNQNRWIPVDCGKINEDNQSIIFRNINDSLLYCAMFYHEGKLKPANVPFFPVGQNAIQFFEPNYNHLVNLSFPIDTIQTRLSSELYIWDGRWKYNAMGELNNGCLQFHNVPSGGIYRLGSTRPFWVRNGLIVFSKPGKPFNIRRLNIKTS